MKNIRKFETTAEMESSVLEEYSVSYVIESDKVYTTPENGGQGNGDIKNYMRFVAIEDSQINLTSINPNTGEADNSVDLKHSKDGITWTQYDFNPIPLAAGETLYLKGNNENGFSYMNEETGELRLCSFGDTSEMGFQSLPSTGKFECHGNIMSLLYGDDFENKTTIPNAFCFAYLFFNCSGLTTAPELPATTMVDYCYQNMFDNCTSLTTAPELPATTLADNCYLYMFSGCTSLTKAPSILPATTLADSCYSAMFYHCTSLTTAPELPSTTLADNCYNGMFNDCTSLTTAPELPATTLAEGCYSYMFDGCTSLNHITMLATNASAYNCLNEWVSGVASTGTFVKHPDMTSLPTGESGIPEGWTVENAVI